MIESIGLRYLGGRLGGKIIKVVTAAVPALLFKRLMY